MLQIVNVVKGGINKNLRSRLLFKSGFLHDYCNKSISDVEFFQISPL